MLLWIKLCFLFFFLHQVNLPRENTGMLAVLLKDSLGVKYAEDYIKLSVAQSGYIYPTKVIYFVVQQKRYYFTTTKTIDIVLDNLLCW